MTDDYPMIRLQNWRIVVQHQVYLLKKTDECINFIPQQVNLESRKFELIS